MDPDAISVLTFTKNGTELYKSWHEVLPERYQTYQKLNENSPSDTVLIEIQLINCIDVGTHLTNNGSENN